MLRKITAVMFVVCVFANAAVAQSGDDRMFRQASKKLTLEFQDTKLSEACDIVRSLTGLAIIIHPALLAENPAFSLKVNDMDAATVINWFTTMTDTHAELVDQAIFITKQKPAEAKNKERAALLELGALNNVVLDLPAEGFELTDQDRVKIALQIIEKTTPKITDYPGPELNLGGTLEAGTTIFGK